MIGASVNEKVEETAAGPPKHNTEFANMRKLKKPFFILFCYLFCTFFILGLDEPVEEEVAESLPVHQTAGDGK